MSRDREAFEPTLVQAPSAPELVDVGAPLLDAPAHARYEAGEVLGAGGMGEVRLCRDTRVGRKVAVKRLKPGFGSRGEARVRFLREARVQGQLEHPAIVPVYDLGVGADGVEFFTMKRVRGQTLADVLAEGTQSQRKLLTAFSSVCMAVHYAHTRGVLHRDLKPANVMLGDFGEVYVLDWGLAKVTGAPDAAGEEIIDTPSPDGEAQTQAGYILGTPGYIAPEVLEGAEPDARADVYALGAILFEILSGEPLRPGRTPDERVAATLEGTERAPGRDAPPELVALCRRATARDAAARLASALELREGIERFLDGDRDLALRREAAERHAEVARAALERALAEDGPGAEERKRALAEVGRAIAMDPENAGAKATLLALLTTPPRVPPREAIEEFEQHEVRTVKVDARVGLSVYSVFLLFVPGILWMGVKSWSWFFGAFALLLGTLGAMVLVARSNDRWSKLPYASYLFSLATLAMVSCTFGPYVTLPGVVAVNAMAFAGRPQRFTPPFLLVTSALVVILPVAMQFLGWMEPNYLFEDGRIVILSHSVHLPVVATQLVLFLSSVGTVVAATLFMSHTHGPSAEAERRLFLHAWQLRQLVPKNAQDAVRQPAVVSEPDKACPILHL